MVISAGAVLFGPLNEVLPIGKVLPLAGIGSSLGFELTGLAVIVILTVSRCSQLSNGVFRFHQHKPQ